MGRGDPITLMVARDAEHEGECVAMRIASHKFEHRGKFSDYAVLYRGNHQARVIETRCASRRFPTSSAAARASSTVPKSRT